MQTPTQVPAPEMPTPTQVPAPEMQTPTQVPAPEMQTPTHVPAPEMQTPTQVPGQVPREVSGEPHQNPNAPIGTGLPWPRWQSEQDIDLRHHIFDNILQSFNDVKPHMTPGWQQKLPRFVNRLEELLYKNAPSKDEYADLQTLEPRLQSVARLMLSRPPPQSVGSSAPTSDTVSTPSTVASPNDAHTSLGVPPLPSVGSSASTGDTVSTPSSVASMNDAHTSLGEPET